MDDDRLYLNQQEMAEALRVSSNTLSRVVRQNPDFPVVRGGSNGVPYAFDPGPVIEWWKAKGAAAMADQDARRRLVEQAELELYGPGEAESPAEKPLTPGERKTMVETAIQVDRLRRSRGELLERVPLEGAIATAASALRQRLMQIPNEFAKSENLTREQRVRLEEMLTRALNQMAETLSSATFYENRAAAA